MSNGPVFEAGPGWGEQLSMWMRDNLVYVVPGVVVIVFIIILAASGGDNTSPLVASATPSPTATAMLSETVIARDSYTTLARRAVTAYVGTTAATETAGQRLYAETILVSTMKGQSLAVGTIIPFSTTNMQIILNDYAKLYPSQRAKWEAMAKNVKF